MSELAVVGKLKEKFGDVVLDVVEFRDETTVTVSKESIVEVSTFLKEEEGYNVLCDICGVDYLGQIPRFMVVYNLYNIAEKQRLRVKVPVEESAAVVDSVEPVWTGAGFPERECWDLMGIRFDGNSDLRRILMAEDWEGHPLRKDYPVQGPGREPYQDRVS